MLISYNKKYCFSIYILLYWSWISNSVYFVLSNSFFNLLEINFEIWYFVCCCVYPKLCNKQTMKILIHAFSIIRTDWTQFKFGPFEFGYAENSDNRGWSLGPLTCPLNGRVFGMTEGKIKPTQKRKLLFVTESEVLIFD